MYHLVFKRGTRYNQEVWVESFDSKPEALRALQKTPRSVVAVFEGKQLEIIKGKKQVVKETAVDFGEVQEDENGQK